jgi:hypothetical protein
MKLNQSLVLLCFLSRSVQSFSIPATTRNAAFVRSTTIRNMSSQKLPVIAPEDVMAPKKHGTSDKPVMKELRWSCDYDVADRICNFNRHYAEYAGKLVAIIVAL